MLALTCTNFQEFRERPASTLTDLFARNRRYDLGGNSSQNILREMKERFRRAFLASTFPGFGETTRKSAQLVIPRIEATARGGHNPHLSSKIVEIEDLGGGSAGRSTQGGCSTNR
jgi:hypothetical protein